MYICFIIQLINMKSNIEIQRIEKSKIASVDFNNLPFGSVYSDHMLECDFKDGKWQTPVIKPYAPISLDPSAKIFHYGQSIFEGMKAYKDSDDNILLCGSFFGSEYFAPGDDESLVSSNGSNDIFLLKLDSDGNFLWVKTIGGSASDLTEFITTDSYGNIYIAGRFKDTVDFDFSDTSENFLVSSGGYDIFLQKLDNDGNFIWVEQFGALSDDFINAFTVDNEGENI